MALRVDVRAERVSVVAAPTSFHPLTSSEQWALFGAPVRRGGGDAVINNLPVGLEGAEAGVAPVVCTFLSLKLAGL